VKFSNPNLPENIRKTFRLQKASFWQSTDYKNLVLALLYNEKFEEKQTTHPGQKIHFMSPEDKESKKPSSVT
jgi:hypothetical protein